LVSSLAAAALCLYLAMFFASPLPSLAGISGVAVRRIAFYQFLLLPEFLAAQWCGSPAELSLLDRLPILLAAAAILGCAAAIGWLLLAVCRVDRQFSRLESCVFSTTVGLNVLSTYVLGVGLLGWLGSRTILALPAVLALLAAVHWWMRKKSRAASHDPPGPAQRPCRAPAAPGRGPEPPLDSGLAWFWTGLAAGPFLLVVLLGAVLPPVDFDVREYHLQAPKEFYQQGRIGFMPHNVYANMPLGTEMLSLLAMVLIGDWWWGALVGKTVIAAFAPLTALGLLSAGWRFVSLKAGMVAAVIYISIPWIVQVSTSGLVEGASACYLFMAVYAMLLWQKAQTPASPCQDAPCLQARYVALAGYLAGGAVSCKYPAVLFVVVPLVVWLFAVHRAGRPLRLGKALGSFMLAVAVGCGAWFAKNWALTGNPTYPLLAEIFDGATRTPEKNRQWNRVHQPKDFSLRALGSDLARVGLQSEWLSPLLFPLAALGMLNPRHRRTAWIVLSWFLYTVGAWWLLTHRIDRFWIPVLPLLALLAGAGAEVWWEVPNWVRRVVVVVLVVLLVWNLLAVTSGPGGYNRYFVSLARLRTAPERVDPWHRYFNAHVTEGRVLMVGDAQVFDLEVPVLYNTCFDDSLLEQLTKGRTAQQIQAAFDEQGISHVFVHWGEISRYRTSGYGFTDYVQPDLLEWLVEQKVLEPLPPQEYPAGHQHLGRGYRVIRQSVRAEPPEGGAANN